MSKEQFLSIETGALAGATGGVSRTGSTTQQVEQTLKTITDTLSDLKNQDNNSSLAKVMPFVVMAKVMRDRNA